MQILHPDNPRIEVRVPNLCSLVHRRWREKYASFITGTGGALWMEAPPCGPLRASAGGIRPPRPEIMEPADSQGMPNDVLIVEDDAIIALDFEDTIIALGVKQVRCAGSVARALRLIEERAP